MGKRTMTLAADGATVIINGVERTTFCAEEGTLIEWSVSAEGYQSQNGSFILADNVSMVVKLLLPRVTFTIQPTPADAVVVINGEQRNSIEVIEGTEVVWEVSAEHYVSQSGTQTVSEDTTKAVTLELQTFTFTIQPTPSDAVVTINGEVRTSIEVPYGTEVSWEVSADGYVTQSGSQVVTADTTKTVVLEQITYYTFTIEPTPSDATVIINGEVRNSVTVLAGTEVTWEVSADGYVTQSGSQVVTEDTTKAVVLEQITYYTFTIEPTPSDAVVIINGEQRNSITVPYGTEVTWEVSADGYVTQSGTQVVTEDTTKTVVLEQITYYTFTIEPTPSDATVIINGEVRNSITVPYGTEVTWEVSADGYVTQSGSQVVTEDTTKTVVLEQITYYTFTIEPTPSDAVVIINGEQRNSITVPYGTEVTWEVSADGYVTQSGSRVVTGNTTINVTLVANTYTFTIQPTPSDATVIINGEERKSITVPYGTEVTWEVSADGYVTQSGSQVVTEDTTKTVVLVVQGEAFVFVYDSNSMYIYSGTACSSSSTACLFAINGEYDIEINGVRIEGVKESTTFGSEYLNDTGNIVKIYTHEGTTINHRYNNYTNGSSYNQTRYISEIQSWGAATFGICSYMFAMSGTGASTLKTVPKFSEGFAGVTSMTYMFYYCNSLTELADGLFDNCTAVTTFSCCFQSCSGLTSLPENLFANCTAVMNFSYCFYGCSKLTSLPENLFAGCTAVTSFADCFYSCSGLTSLPTGLFAGCTAVTTFSYCFYSCTGLTSLPEGLFANCTKVTTFSNCFRGCSGLTSLPENLFAGCTAVTNFQYCFHSCTGLTSLPENLFAGCTAVTSFSYCFYSCSGLTSLPTGLFAGCTAVTNFSYCFHSCTGLTSLPENLFAGCTAVTSFADCFYSCSGLTSLPTGLFAGCTAVTTFSYCFRGCTKLTSLPENLFASCTKVTNFSYCFDSNSSSTHNLEGESAYDRVTIDGVETIIHLYERENYPSIYTAPTTTSYCYRYQEKLDDYDSIPDGWK